MGEIFMHRFNSSISTVASLSLSLLCAAGFFLPAPATAQSTSDNVIYLNQAWSQDDREWYYHFSQGSAVISYDIFLNLEVAGGQDLFRSNANSAQYGLFPEAANQFNPDALPIGIAKTTIVTPLKGWPAGDYAAVTCAACHEGEWDYKGKRLLIDGGTGNRIELIPYVQALDDALQATLSDSAKFDRLAARLGATSPDAKDKLRKRLGNEAERVHIFRTRTTVLPFAWGPGRMDAIALIIDRLTAVVTDIPENWHAPTAPTKPPFLWNAPQGLWTQWRAVQQDPIYRNLVETMGVFMPIDLTSKTPAEGLFQSNAALLDLQRVENQLARLAPPSWPEDLFGKIDREKAKAGKALFVSLCSGCHNAWPYTWSEANKYGKRFILVGVVPQTYVGTDPEQFRNVQPFAITGQLADYLPREFHGKDIIPTADLYYIASRLVLETALAKLKLTPEQEANIHGYRAYPLPRPPEGVYKAAPRDGVWATPPFLHNGSVPSLYELLLPAAERTKKFCVGHEFDPVKVGVDTTCGPGSFMLDTALLGNSNAGHSFQDSPRGDGVIGPLLTDEQRWDLVEYLKSIPEEPGRVTPFGGPPETSAAQKP
jgi:hypothetical protein